MSDEKALQLAQPRRALDGETALDRIMRDADLLRTYPVENLERLVALQREVRADDARQAYNVAFRDVQSELDPVVKDAWNDHTKSWYARVATIMASVDPIAQRHGFSRSISTKPSAINGWLCFVLTLRHVDGHTEEHTFDAPPDGSGPKGGSNMNAVQGAKSTYTYAEGALIQKVWGIQLAEQDDDGNAGGGTPVVPISVKQAQILRELIEDAGADLPRFLAHYKTETVEKLPKNLFEDAVSALNARKARAASIQREAAAQAAAAGDAVEVEAEEVTDEEPADPDRDGRVVCKGTKFQDGRWGAYVPHGTKVGDEIFVMKSGGGMFPRIVEELVDDEPNEFDRVRAVTKARPKEPEG